MSHNQSTAERTESTQYRKSGRSNHYRNFSGGGSKGNTGIGGGAIAPPPSSSSSSTFNTNNNNNQSSLSSNRSFKKHNNVQGGQARAIAPSTQALNPDSNTHSAARTVQNGPQLQQQPSHGVATAKPADVATPKASRAPRAPSSNIPATGSGSKHPQIPVTPAKAEASQSYHLQFGSISPGLMNGMQIPARTSSAPPNLDEQKRDQARHDSLRAPAALPFPSIPRQQLPKNTVTVDQSSAAESAKPKRETYVLVTPPVSQTHQTQKPSLHPIARVPVQIPFHQPQVPVQFGGPNPQIQSQAMSATSLPMAMPIPMLLPMGQQQVVVSGLQPHPLQSQGILHQGQNLSFSTQMGPQIPPPLGGNIGINMPPQFPQQQAGKFGGPRVKITHPETHEELRLDGSPAPRSYTNVPPQSQPISSFPPAHPPNFFPGSYNASSLFFSASTSHPLTSTHPPSQPTRYQNQVTVKPASYHGEKDATSLASSPRAPKGESQKTLKPSPKDAVSLSQSSLQQSKPGVGQMAKSVADASKAVVPPRSDSGQSPVPNSFCPASLVSVQKPATVLPGGESLASELTGKLDSTNQGKVDGRSISVLVLSPQEAEVVATTVPFSTSVVLENPNESLSTAATVELDAVDLESQHSEENKLSEFSERSVSETREDDQFKSEVSGEKDQVEVMCIKEAKIVETSLTPSASEPAKVSNQTMESSGFKGSSEASSQEPVGTVVRQMEESTTLSMENDDHCTGSLVPKSSIQDTGNAEPSSEVGLGTQNDKVSSLGSSLGRSDNVDARDAVVTRSSLSDKETMSVAIPSSEENYEHELNIVEEDNAGLVSSSLTKEKVLPETNIVKSTAARGKKKRRELFKKLESSGPIPDLYLAYKGPEEKKETIISSEMTESTSSNNMEPLCSDLSQTEVTKENTGQSKVEPDDWEDAADISTPKLETSENARQVDTCGVDSNGALTKKYSRDFLLKFAEQCTGLPEGFELRPDIAEALIASRDPYSSSGRIVDRPSLDRRGSGLGEEEKWSKVPGSLMTGRDMRMDMNYGPNMVMFRPTQVPNHGVLRNPRLQPPLSYQGGIFPGQMQSLVPQVGVPRNSPESERWQRGTAFQKGIMPSPQTPLQVMHRAEKKYEIGKVTDEEETKQRQLKAILNKLTPQNFEKLFEQVKLVNIDNAVTLSGVISQIFDKALMEPTFCEMYANFCHDLAAELPDLSVDSEKITFKRLLLNKCQEEFERGEREQEEANKVDVKGEANLSPEKREEKRLRARRRMLGNIRLIGELYKKKMLTERIMHDECIKKLLGQYQNPDEEDVEALCKLMSTIGEMIDHPKAKEHMDVYFDMMDKLSNNMKLSSRVRFMLKDAIDLRKNKWQQRRKVEGPKKIKEVHRDAAQERQAQARGLARAPSMGSSVRRVPPVDFSPRGSNILSSPSSQMGGFRAMPQQLRGYGAQDFEERHALDNRTLSVPLPQRPLGDDITLGPQRGLGRGMSYRGHSAAPGVQLPDLSSTGDSRRVGPGLNGYNSVSERPVQVLREDPMQRFMSDRLGGPSAHDQSSTQERNIHYGNRDVRGADRGFDRSVPISPPARSGGAFTQNVTSDKVWPEERLRDMSMSAIKEFYSAKDENEVALCIKELNNSSFYPSMISLWVTDSFERKDMERDLLVKLLITLTKHRDGIISQDQLIKGFDSVLMTLEDAVNDAPKAAEFLGRIFARVILENVIPFNEIERLIYEGGEEQGRLAQIGLAAEVLGSMLEVIATEKGDSALTEIRSGSSLQWESFRPPSSNKSWRLDKFI